MAGGDTYISVPSKMEHIWILQNTFEGSKNVLGGKIMQLFTFKPRFMVFILNVTAFVVHCYSVRRPWVRIPVFFLDNDLIKVLKTEFASLVLSLHISI